MTYTYFYRKVSDMLEEETKKMEDKLEMVKKMMELEKEKRNQQVSQAALKKGSIKGDNGMWRSATNKKQISGYSEMVLNNHAATK